MKYYLEEKEEVLRAVDSSEKGLDTAQVRKRLSENGPNKLKEGKKDSLAKRFLKQIKDPMIIILIIAAAVSGITSAYANESFADVFIILFVVIINAVLGVYQESKAEKAIEALQQMAASMCKVIRNGEMTTVKSEDIVVGDIIVVEAGDAIPADARIIECASLKIEEAALTGESVPVNKLVDVLSLGEHGDVALGDRKNMLYMGSTVAYGRAKAVVVATGMDTEMGKIAGAISNAKDNLTPLQIKLNQLSKALSFIVLGICAFIFVFSFVRAGTFDIDTAISTFMVAVSLAVAAIPEGLAAVVTIVLSIGVTNMSKRNAIIRKLTAVETLGCAQIICSDKTGTLTQNKMTVVEHYGTDEEFLAGAMALCSDAQLNSEFKSVGEPTECALVDYAYKLGIDKNEALEQLERVGEAPFDSMRKMMSTIHSHGGRFVQYTKGAPDVILANCTHYLKDGKVLPLNSSVREEIMLVNKSMADKALRVLAAAFKDYRQMPASTAPQDIENNLTFIGLVGMIDPVRPEVKEAIKKCKSAGIRPIMITGDHKDTAVAIAKELGIIKDASQAITGAEISQMSDEEFDKAVAQFSVYARVQPEHKVRIVSAWQKRGKVTAMTGDGVNDAPSIKTADIGVGMGITGTDVTKNVADMVLADDNFATIVNAVAEGRRIYDNIRKSIQFLLSSNLSEIVSIFTATLLGFTILKPVHILWINLITDTFPALGLGTEGPERDLMTRKPRSTKDGIFAGGLGFDVVYQGVLISIVTIAAYFIGHFIESGRWEIVDSPDGITMAFLTMSLAEIFHSFNLRSQRKSIFSLKSHNKLLYITMLASLALTTIVIYVPFISDAFGFEHISFQEYAISVILAFSVIPIVEIVKIFQRLFARKK